MPEQHHQNGRASYGLPLVDILETIDRVIAGRAVFSKVLPTDTI